MQLASTTKPPRFQYTLPPWGELIYGTKDELQDLGLGQGMAFPSEPGCPRRTLKITDPRGFPCKIERAEYHGNGQFSACIHIPGRECPDAALENYAPGVTLERIIWADFYSGTSDALIKSGLVRATQFPGAPGMGKTIAKFLADGTVAPAGCNLSRLSPGCMSIWRATTRIFNVYVVVDETERSRRYETARAKTDDYERRMASMPRPTPLAVPSRDAAAQARRAQLRLVWSNPTS